MRQGRSHFCVNLSHLLKLSKGNNQEEEKEIDQVIRKPVIHRNRSLETKKQQWKVPSIDFDHTDFLHENSDQEK